MSRPPESLRPAAVAALALAVAAAGPRPAAAQDRPAAARERPDPPGEWRAELVGRLLEPWTRHGRDTAAGAFRTHLDRRWRAAGPAEKYPSMLGRHLFSYSAGYLLTGEDRWLARADSVYRYLLRHGWDERHGGWYDRLRRSGAPADRSKSTFVQVYAATGLALYHFVTRRPGALRRARRTNRLLEARFRDPEHGGYYQQLDRDFTVVDSSKTAASQLAPVSGHLLYLYAGTRDTAYLRQSRRLLRHVTRRMRDPTSGWIRERFTADWEPAPGPGPETHNVGHNVEVAWLLARLHLAGAHGSGGDAAHGERALELAERVAGAGFLEETGAWLHRVTRAQAASGGAPPDSGRVLWWIQAYGDMTQLTLHRLASGPDAAGARPGDAAAAALGRYRAGVAFWRRHLLDPRFGAAVTAVGARGDLRDGGKGGRWKTSYHSVEHALWNHLGEALWLEPGRPVTLHFRPWTGGGSAEERRRVCPVLVPDPTVSVRAVERGGRPVSVPSGAACFRVPAAGPPVEVQLVGRGASPR